jgi:hypothetical protein
MTPSILISFTGLIFPERNVLFFLACLVLSVRRFEQTKSIAWGMAGGRGGLCSASLGLRGSEAHAAAEKRTECAMGLRSALERRKQS